MKYAVEMGSGAMIYIQSFIKTVIIRHPEKPPLLGIGCVSTQQYQSHYYATYAHNRGTVGSVVL
jgi:hypothetical protein